ncbi:flagellar brake protein [Parachitinimonas caeni]|uniref:Flagellar brake protein YcgR n=1 Tax=Parachitinimonas caeni TaxID=3031301 RepID=A0ABT7DWD5_9NEIS|nr:flagellar brake protein [Parachitinimonas caeni]MDK2122967.1 flagellar brake protein [Parachitinimonas caeni]
MVTASPPLVSEEVPRRITEADLAAGQPMTLANAAEIAQLLTAVASGHEMVCLYFGQGADDFALSAILGVDPQHHSFVLDFPADTDSLPQTSEGYRLLCVTSQNRIKIQFEVVARDFMLNGRAALLAALPQSVLRLQRRDHYRLTTPLGQPLSCHIPVSAQEEIEVALIDISLGGMGILGYVPGLKLAPGTCYAHVRIELPGTGTIVADIQVRSTFDITLRNGIRSVRTGCQFLNLPGTMQALVQRYITRIERERLARLQQA